MTVPSRDHSSGRNSADDWLCAPRVQLMIDTTRCVLVHRAKFVVRPRDIFMTWWAILASSGRMSPISRRICSEVFQNCRVGEVEGRLTRSAHRRRRQEHFHLIGICTVYRSSKNNAVEVAWIQGTQKRSLDLSWTSLDWTIAAAKAIFPLREYRLEA